MHPESPIPIILPHRPPAVWIDRVVHCEKEQVICSLTLPCPESSMRSWSAALGIEILAQAAAIWMSNHAQGCAGRAGMLVRCNRLLLHVLSLSVNEEFTATVRPVLSSDQPLHLFQGELKDAQDNLLVDAEFAILLGPAV